MMSSTKRIKSEFMDLFGEISVEELATNKDLHNLLQNILLMPDEE
jgi:hypothetical protein